jgi:hypothetical protein
MTAGNIAAAASPASSPAPAPAESAVRDMQRRSLEQVVRLSIECAAEEQRIEQEHNDSLARENTAHKTKSKSSHQRYQRRMADLATGAQQRTDAIQSKYDTQKSGLEHSNQANLRQIARGKEEAESNLKKQVEQACWAAEKTLVALQMAVDADEIKDKKEEEISKADVASVDALEAAANEAIARYRMTPIAVEPAPPDSALQQRLAADRLAVLAEYRQKAGTELKEIQEITELRVIDDVVPVFLVGLLGGIAGAVGWFVPPDEKTKLMAAGGAALGGIILGIILFMVLRSKKHKRVRARARAAYEPFMGTIHLARKAATFDVAAAAAAREQRVTDARRKRDQEAAAARDQAKPLLARIVERHRQSLADEAQRLKDGLAEFEAERSRNLEELQQARDGKSKQYVEEDTSARAAADAEHAAAMQAIEARYTADCDALAARWEQGLRAVAGLMADSGGIDPQLIDWSSPAWEEWKSPREFSGQVRFGEMKVDLAQLTAQIPKRLKLPETFHVPAMLALPAQASLLVETDHTGRSAGIGVIQMAMARLLTQMPAGRVKFTIFDPVGLGQSFAGFMHLADHDESLVGARIWTEREHMQQRLADLTEHMETVIQKYLRNEYATIDQYNAQAGELAEPIRFLVLADFPTGFDQEMLRRLASIAISGPRCGVYTLIHRDTRQAVPPGSRLEDIAARSVHLRFRNGEFHWEDAVFKQFPLKIDPPPGEKVLTRLMEQVGKAAKDAKRVEVPFQSIAPRNGDFWSMSTREFVRVPIGKSGATRLQALRLGVGVAQHTLIAGKTGSGKSNLMHTIVTNLAMWYPPDEIEFYLVDFKKGVEFKAYVARQLPHARAIAVESDREFGISVLQRVDAELTRRGELFRDAGVQDLASYRDKTGQSMPRTLLLIDEFQEFFAEEDKLSQEAAGLMDRLVRQGRAFGVHLVLGSQSIGGTSGLSRSTLGQIAVRVALQCSEADSQMILGDNNSAARLLTRPGEAIYNDAGGLIEANSPFQIAFLPDDQREEYLERIRTHAQAKATAMPTPIVFEGNTAAAIRKNDALMALLRAPGYPAAGSAIPAYLGEPVAIKDPTAVRFRRQGGVNLLMVGQQEESAVGIFSSIASSIAAQQPPRDAIFYLMDGTPNDSRYFGMLERVLKALPTPARIVQWRETPEAINELAQMLAQRQGNADQPGPSIYLLLFGLQRYRLLRRSEDDFSFSRSEEPAAPKPDKQFAELLSEGPPHGIHTLIWADTPITVERTLERSAMRQFDYRILFQMSASDSSNLIDSPMANRLGAHRALLYSEEQGTF